MKDHFVCILRAGDGHDQYTSDLYANPKDAIGFPSSTLTAKLQYDDIYTKKIRRELTENLTEMDESWNC